MLKLRKGHDQNDDADDVSHSSINIVSET